MALEVFFWLNVEEAALKFARPMFVSSPRPVRASQITPVLAGISRVRKILRPHASFHFVSRCSIVEQKCKNKIELGTMKYQLSPRLILSKDFRPSVCDPGARRKRAQGSAARIRHYGLNLPLKKFRT